MTFSVDTQSITGDEAITITASMSGFLAGESIKIKGVLLSDGSQNYFGLTGIGDSWISNDADNKDQPEVIIGTWDGTFKVKSIYSDSGFIGNGQYVLKTRFYILNNGDWAGDWSDNVISIAITAPDPTPSPIPTYTPTVTTEPTHSPTPKPTSTPTIKLTSIPTLTPTNASILFPTATTIPVISLSPTGTIETSDRDTPDTVILGASTDGMPLVGSDEKAQSDSGITAFSKKPLFLAMAIISAGLAFLAFGSALMIAFGKKKREIV